MSFAKKLIEFKKQIPIKKQMIVELEDKVHQDELLILEIQARIKKNKREAAGELIEIREMEKEIKAIDELYEVDNDDISDTSSVKSNNSNKSKYDHEILVQTDDSINKGKNYRYCKACSCLVSNPYTHSTSIDHNDNVGNM